MLFDTHAHLNDDAFQDDREEILQDLPQNGVGCLLHPGCHLADSRQAVALAEKYPFVYAAVGTHPDSASEVNEAVIQAYRMLCKQSNKVKAIGEIGVDYYYETISRDIQLQAFRMQMALAAELDLPVIIHQRDAWNDCLEVIGEFPQVKGVFHCFSGSAEMAEQLVKQGWYIGFTGVLTFKNARRAVEAAERIPLDRIVLETDCPYMAPEPFRGKRNDPRYLYRMAQRLGEIRGLSFAEIQEITTQNAKRLYRIEAVQ